MAINHEEISQDGYLHLVWSETTVYVERLHDLIKQSATCYIDAILIEHAVAHAMMR